MSVSETRPRSIFDTPPTVEPHRVRRAKNRAKWTREYRESIRDIFHRTDYLVNILEQSGTSTNLTQGHGLIFGRSRSPSRQAMRADDVRASPTKVDAEEEQEEEEVHEVDTAMNDRVSEEEDCPASD